MNAVARRSELLNHLFDGWASVPLYLEWNWMKRGALEPPKRFCGKGYGN